MTRVLLCVLLSTAVGCGSSTPTPPANPDGPRPLPGGAGPKPAGNKTEWDGGEKPKPKSGN